MRLLHYLSRVDVALGGVVRAVLDLTSALADAGQDVVLATLEHPSRQAATGVQVIEGKLGYGEWISRRSVNRLNEIAATADVVHLHGTWDLGAYRFASALRRMQKPYVVSVHGMLDNWSMAQKRWKKELVLALAGRRFCRGAAVIHTTAEGERRQVQPRLGGDDSQYWVQPYVISTGSSELPGVALAESIFPQLRCQQPVVLFLSRLHYKKGPELLIEAVGRLRQEGHQVQLVLAGPGDPSYVNRLKQMVAQGASGDVLFTGMVDGSLKRSLYQRADVFVLPTYQENFGIVLVEALSARVPVVTTRGVDIWPELQQAGAVIAACEAPAIAAAVRDLLSAGETERRTRADVGKAFIEEWLSPQRIVRAFIQMYAQAAHVGQVVDGG